MTALTALPGGGEPAPVAPCVVCGVPHHGRRCGVLQRHLDGLKLRGHTVNSIYCRERAIIRMGKLLPAPVLDADAEMLAEWRAGLDMSHGSIAGYVAHAREFYRFAVKEGLRGDNPAADLPVPRQPRRLPRPINEKDLMRALETAPRRIRLWIVLAAWCGLRACEVAGLLRDSIMDSAVPPVLIVTLETAKGGRRERCIPLSTYVLEEIRAAQLPTAGFAFRRMDGHSGPLQPWRISQLVNRHLHGLGIAATLHSMRHRMLSQAYQGTLDLRLVQDLAGHADPRTTSGYAQFASESAVKAVEGLPSPGRLHAVREDREDRA